MHASVAFKLAYAAQQKHAMKTQEELAAEQLGKNSWQSSNATLQQLDGMNAENPAGQYTCLQKQPKCAELPVLTPTMEACKAVE